MHAPNKKQKNHTCGYSSIMQIEWNKSEMKKQTPVCVQIHERCEIDEDIRTQNRNPSTLFSQGLGSSRIMHNTVGDTMLRLVVW